MHTTGGYMVGTLSDDQIRLRSPRKRHLLVHRGRRLGHRPQLRRLRPAEQRRDGADVRRCAQLSRFLAILGDDRAAQSDASSTPRRPRSARSCAPGGSLSISTICRSLRLLGTVGEPINPEAWMWYHEVIGHEQMPDRRYLVADRNRHDHDHAAARRDADQARHRDASVLRHRRGDRRSRRQGTRPESGRPAGHPQALAGDAARDLQRPRALSEAILERRPRLLFHRRRRPARRRRLLLDHGPRRRCDQRLAAIGWARRRSKSALVATKQSPRRPALACRTR